MKPRPEALREIESQPFDVCVIGAGATGSGCALDAQLRGLRTALLDAADFSSGSSSASTKLAHGGVRYLQQAVADFDPGQLKVVRQALRERLFMIENAPHLAHPCEFIVPCFSRFEMAYYTIGLKLYEWFAGRSSLGPSRSLSRERTLTFLPTLNRDHLAGGVAYFDGQFDDARYGVALVKSFADVGGVVANYLAVVGFERNFGGEVTAALAQDVLSGRTFRVEARAFVNATGPYSDRLRSLARPGMVNRLVLSKGVHILLPLTPGVTRALLIPETEDGRVIFAIPWLGRLLVGTTDDEVSQGQELTVRREEAEYLLRHLNRYSVRTYTLKDVVGAFSGVRPLVRAKHAQQTKNLIREHEVEIDQASGLISILGGKWTTYRAMAEDTIDAAQERLGVPRTPSSTRQHRLAGGAGYTSDDWRSLVEKCGLTKATALHLSEKYGTETLAVLAIARERSDLTLPLVAMAAPIQAEVVYAARREMAVTLEDVLARRIGLQFFSWQLAVEAAPVAANHLARELRWTDPQKENAIREYISKMERRSQDIGMQSA
jgi:glycerol-3-phosphate dehydrogenase